MHSFTTVHHDAHVVAAAVPEGMTSGQLRILGAGCRRLALSLPATSDFATGVVRNEGEPEFRCLFVSLADAEKFGACINARNVAKREFASQRRFTIDDALLQGFHAESRRSHGGPRRRVESAEETWSARPRNPSTRTHLD